MFASGIFHLVTHAFFKACLFLGAGSVILSMHHEQDIQKMGGLKEYMPRTFWTFLFATLALAGIFPLSGFFSKDEILWQAFSRGGSTHLFYILWFIGLLGAFATAFYMFRLVSLTFFGRLRTKVEHQRHEPDALEARHSDKFLHQPATPLEQPFVITGVLITLAALSVIGGFMGVPAALGEKFGIPNFFEHWLEPVFEIPPNPPLIKGGEGGFAEYLLIILSLAVAISGISLAVWLYTKRQDIVKNLTARFAFTYRVVLNKFYVDELYDWLVVRRLLWLNDRIKEFDQMIIDGLVNAFASLGVFWAAVSGWLDWFFVDGAVNVVAETTIGAGKKVRRVQTGHIQHYFYIALLGLIVLLVWRVF
jgi:NADH-quinone oxidoreductase subunit L